MRKWSPHYKENGDRPGQSSSGYSWAISRNAATSWTGLKLRWPTEPFDGSGCRPHYQLDFDGGGCWSACLFEIDFRQVFFFGWLWVFLSKQQSYDWVLTWLADTTFLAMVIGHCFLLPQWIVQLTFGGLVWLFCSIRAYNWWSAIRVHYPKWVIYRIASSWHWCASMECAAQYIDIESDPLGKFFLWTCPLLQSKSYNQFEYLGDSSLVCNISTCCLTGKVITIYPLPAPVRTKQINKNISVDWSCYLHSILYCWYGLPADGL